MDEYIIFYGNRVSDIRMQGDVINTLQARMGTGGNNMPMVATSNVRRITPIECERLQGFPDNWTEGQPDTHRYKQMGNAVAVPVVEWVIQNICDTV
jgi:DNA (cytosine-5)-methyltransferase 1